MNITHQILTIAILASFLTACGGGGSSDSNSGGGDTSGGGNSGGGNSGGGNSGGGNSGGGNSGSGASYSLVDPVTPLTLEATTLLGTKQKAGFSGDIEVVKKAITTQDNQTFEIFEYQLKNGIPNLNVTDVIRVESSRFDCPASNTELKGKGSGTVTYNYKAGEVVIKATSSGFSVDCTYKITPFAGTTISGNTSIRQLFNDWGDDYEKNAISMTGSSCPKVTPDNTTPDNEKPPTKEELARIFEEYKNCKIEIVKNITVTDGVNKTHKVAQAGSLSFGFLLLFMTGLFRRFIK